MCVLSKVNCAVFFLIGLPSTKGFSTSIFGNPRLRRLEAQPRGNSDTATPLLVSLERAAVLAAATGCWFGNEGLFSLKTGNLIPRLSNSDDDNDDKVRVNKVHHQQSFSIEGARDGTHILERTITRRPQNLELTLWMPTKAISKMNPNYLNLEDRDIHIFYPRGKSECVQLIDSRKCIDSNVFSTAPSFVQCTTLAYGEQRTLRERASDVQRLVLAIDFDPLTPALVGNGISMSKMYRLGKRPSGEVESEVLLLSAQLPEFVSDFAKECGSLEEVCNGSRDTSVLRLRGGIEISYGLVLHNDCNSEPGHSNSAHDPLSHSFLEVSLYHANDEPNLSVRREFTKHGEVVYAGVHSENGVLEAPKPCPFA